MGFVSYTINVNVFPQCCYYLPFEKGFLATSNDKTPLNNKISLSIRLMI